jgi:hypothetical protein
MSLSSINQVSPLDGLASAASILLIFELAIIIILLSVLALLLAFVMHWIYTRLIPPIEDNVPRIHATTQTAERLSGRVVDVVGEIYARRRAVEAAINAFFDALSNPSRSDDTEMNIKKD